MFLAGIVVFRVFFATIYVCKWKWRYSCDKRYSVKPYNLEKAFKKIRTIKQDDEYSSDDMEMFQIAQRIMKEKNLGFNDPRLTEKEKLEMTMEVVQESRKKKAKADDELASADEEEFEDRIVEQFRTVGRPLEIEEVSRFSRKGLVDANMSVLSSVMRQTDVHRMSQVHMRSDRAT